MAKITLASVAERLERLEKRQDEHDEILVRGSPSLQETVRTLAKTVKDYIEQKEKEEEEKRSEWKKYRLLLASVFLPIAVGIIGQGIYFYFKIVPLMELAAVK